MKRWIFCILIGAIFCACNAADSGKKLRDSLYNDSVMRARFNFNPGDSLNVIDPKGQRQGHWVIFGRDAKDNSFAQDAKVEEGKYVDGKKEGMWMEYYPSGAVKSKGEYSGGKKIGKWAIYDEKGVETGEAIYN